MLTIPFAYVKDTPDTTASLLAGFILAGFLATLAISETRGAAAAHSG